MKQYVCITTMIEHIVVSSAAMYKGTQYEDTWVFYHDALSLMTAKETIEWMIQKDYYRRWILPAKGLHQDDKTLVYYWFRPCGNSPENMPWDTSLNQDVHLAVKRHVGITLELETDSVPKFDMSTPRRGSWAYRRILQEVPSSKRIVQDVNNVFASLDSVRKEEGILVKGLGENYGRRWEKRDKGGEKGGYRPRLLDKDDYGDGALWVHEDARKSVTVKREHAVQRAHGVETKPLHQKIKSK